MNEVIRQLYDRKSVRVFTDEAIDEAIVQEILCASAMAPTAGNQQLYTILRISDQGLLDRLAESCDHQPFIAKGKLVLVYCADCLKWYKAFREAGCDPREPGPGDLLLAVDDALIAAQNAVVAAESYGIGSCYIGDIMENMEVQRDILGLPEYDFPAAMLVFGYPTQQQKDREKPRRIDMKHLVFENRYPDMNAERLQDMMSKGMSAEEYRRWMAAFCERKFNSGFAREMSRSVREYLRQYADTDA